MQRKLPTQQEYVIVPLGGPGSGKSTLCNFLIDGEDSQKFVTSKTTKGGETQSVQCESGFALGCNKEKKIKVFDLPGMADPQMPIEIWAEEVREGISTDENIDMVVLVLKSTDYRLDLPQIACMQAMQKFLLDVKPKNTFVCFTHCDESMPDKKFIKEKIESLKKFGGIEVLQENVILFKNSKESLEEFIENMVPGNIKISDEIDEVLEDFD